MKIFFLIAIVFTGVFTIKATTAGSREGYYVLAFPLDAISEHKVVPILKRYFNHQFNRKLYDECSSINGTDTELAYLKKRPETLKTIYVEKALSGKKEALKKTKKIISDYRDAEIHDGFDALIVYRYKVEKIEFWGISPVPEEKNTMAISESLSDKNIAQAICKVLSPLPYAFGP